MVVLHYTGMDSAEAALDRLCDPRAEVSAHYVVGLDGRVWQLVDEARRAWHAGRARWGRTLDVNSRSVGIEIVNPGLGPDAHPFPHPQMRALERLLAAIMVRHAVVPERVVGHACVAPGRKLDPGPRFDWQRLARLGLAVWPEGQPAPAPDAPHPPAPRAPGAGAGAGAAPGAGDDAGRAATGTHRSAHEGACVPPTGDRTRSPRDLPGEDAIVGDAAQAARFRAAAEVFGYGVGSGMGWDGDLLAVWRAFADRFAPALVERPGAPAGIALIEQLAARWPADRLDGPTDAA